jgi:hypothetical protein
MAFSSETFSSNFAALRMSEVLIAHLVEQKRFGLTFGPLGSNLTGQSGDAHS